MFEEIMELVNDYKNIDKVEAFVIRGSRATKKADAKSDYDVYVYITDEISIEERKSLLSKYCSVMEIGNCYWETEDNCTLNNGIDIDVIYRNLDEFSGSIRQVLEEYHSSNGYTTCMWHNLLTSEIIFDKTGRLTALKSQYEIPYPQRLKENIIQKNMNLLSGVLPSFDLQISKAVARGDI